MAGFWKISREILENIYRSFGKPQGMGFQDFHHGESSEAIHASTPLPLWERAKPTSLTGPIS
jgi:hypothetical protein